MSNSHPVVMPLNPNVKLLKTLDTEKYDIPNYVTTIRSLMYTAVGTWPDIAFAVQTPSQFTTNLNPTYWTTIKHVFRYLNGIRDLGITYRTRGDLYLIAYSNAN